MPVPMRGQARTYHCQSMPAASASSHNALSSTGTSAQFARLGIAPQTLWSAKSRTSQSSSKNPSSSGSPWRTPRRLLVPMEAEQDDRRVLPRRRRRGPKAQADVAVASPGSESPTRSRFFFFLDDGWSSKVVLARRTDADSTWAAAPPLLYSQSTTRRSVWNGWYGALDSISAWGIAASIPWTEGAARP
ncbi:hypothetical protein TPAR_06971 [Tolypocladium paradoxum]|uniref:Uncharacterized protein n=1 Tax=Tolypocladium paradoxum TaxID=94208 RepID=A0A2S4KRL1_9HYPO|nr:hypothetical protein TPAR_06971 [Tolypocladium paradoxum]